MIKDEIIEALELLSNYGEGGTSKGAIITYNEMKNEIESLKAEIAKKSLQIDLFKESEAKLSEIIYEKDEMIDSLKGEISDIACR